MRLAVILIIAFSALSAGNSSTVVPGETPEEHPRVILGEESILSVYAPQEKEPASPDEEVPNEDVEEETVEPGDISDEIEQIAPQVIPGKPWLTVYDVDGGYSEKTPTSKSFSNTEIGSCEHIDTAYDSDKSSKIQVIKMIEYPYIKMTECILKLTFRSGPCVKGKLHAGTTSKYKEIQYVNEKLCGKWKNNSTGSIRLFPEGDGRSVFVDDIAAKAHFISREVQIIGASDPEGKCAGPEDWDGAKSVVVSVIIETRRRRIYGRYIPERNSIVVEGGELPMDLYKNGSIHSDALGTFHFNKSEVPANECQHYRTVFAGHGIVRSPKDNQSKMSPIASVLSPGKKPLITVIMEKKIQLCGYPAYSTNLEGFYLALYNQTEGVIPTKNIFSHKDIQHYEIEPLDNINNKINTLFLGLSMVLQSDFATTARAICEAKRMSILNYLSLLGHRYGRAPGRVGNESVGIEVLNYGSVTYVIQGFPLSAQVRNYTFCCEELPVTIASKKNITEVFIDPRTKVIRPYCTKRVCDEAFPYYYQVEMYDQMKENLERKYLCTLGTPEIVDCPETPFKIEVMSASLESQLTDFTVDMKPKIYEDEELRKHHLNQLLYGASKSFSADVAHSFIKDLPEAYTIGGSHKLMMNWYRDDIRKDTEDSLTGHVTGVFWQNLGAMLATCGTIGLLAFGFMKKIAPMVPWGQVLSMAGGLCRKKTVEETSLDAKTLLQPNVNRVILKTKQPTHVGREAVYDDGTVVTDLLPIDVGEGSHNTTIVSSGDQQINFSLALSGDVRPNHVEENQKDNDMDIL